MISLTPSNWHRLSGAFSVQLWVLASLPLSASQSISICCSLYFSLFCILTSSSEGPRGRLLETRSSCAVRAYYKSFFNAQCHWFPASPVALWMKSHNHQKMANSTADTLSLTHICKIHTRLPAQVKWCPPLDPTASSKYRDSSAKNTMNPDLIQADKVVTFWIITMIKMSGGTCWDHGLSTCRSIYNSYIHRWRWLPCNVPTSTSGAVWGYSILPKDTLTCLLSCQSQLTFKSVVVLSQATRLPSQVIWSSTQADH